MSRPAVPLLAFGLASAFPFDSRAEVQLEAAAPATIAFEGLLQADFNWFDRDVVQLNGDDDDREFQLRRAEFVFKGKAGHFDWVLGYDAKPGGFSTPACE
ncbi:OprO/OprP family phosphate-selective porin [Pseudofulvimonas gallinarii]|uniref:OprO/OprP family phosphate-selective porin n=1 Tax=Pseudofulvimonas gallinarii TaxID=634155 RepID=UPI001F0CB7C9|nr:OprO/OprP family phosphate-selective porin [Pseudofulvimonas gallinarii]